MADTTYVDGGPPRIVAAWLQDLNDLFYRGTKALTVTSLTTPLITSSGDIATNQNFNINTSTTAILKLGGASIITRSAATGNVTVAALGGGGTITIDSTASPTMINAAGNTIATFSSIATTGNSWKLENAANGSSPALRVIGTSDVNIGILFSTTGTGLMQFNTGGGAQLQILDMPAASLNMTIKGAAAGGNPTIGVTGGKLAITSTIVIGVNPAASLSVGVPFGGGVSGRNQANTSDVVLSAIGVVNSKNNIVMLGINAAVGTQQAAGTVICGSAFSGIPGVVDLPANTWAVWKDTSGGSVKVYYNDGGVIKASAAFT